MLTEKLLHLWSEDATEIREILNEPNVVAASLHDLGPADVPIQHSFELTNDQSIFHVARRMAPKHNELVQKKFRITLKVGIVAPAS